MGKQEYRYTDRVRFGQLPKEQRKAISKVVSREVMGGAFDHTHICNGEIAAMLTCFEANAWDTAPCMPQITEMYSCVDEHKADPDPKVLARRWQVGLRTQVFQHFAKARVLSRLR